MVEQGTPCIDYKQHHNAITKPRKTNYVLLPKDYFEGCPKISFGDKTFTESDMFRKVQGFKQISEYDILYNNERKTGLLSFTKKIFDYMYDWTGYNRNKLKEYKYDMYQRKYLGWLGSCVIEKGSGTEPVVPR